MLGDFENQDELMGESILKPLWFLPLQFQRRNRIYKEEQRQIRAAARKAKEEAEGAPAVAAHH